MKRSLSFLSFFLIAIHGFSQNTFPGNGNSGIGTINPQAALDIVKSYDAGQTKAIKMSYNGSWGYQSYAQDFRFLDIESTEEGKILQLNAFGMGLGYNPPVYASPDKLYVNGNVGIGTSNPGNYKLNVMGVISGGVNNYSYNAAVSQLTNESKVDGISGVSPTGAFRWYTNPNNSYASGFLYQLRAYDVVSGESGDLLVINGSGNVGIGTTNLNSSKLAVNGNIRAREVKVETANWPDYVFAKDYQLPSLQETEKHIKDKGHLPGIPSAAEVKANGVDLGEMNAKLLQKIEELTLHLIEQNKRNAENQKQIDKRLEELRNENECLKVTQEMMGKELKKLKQ